MTIQSANKSRKEYAEKPFSLKYMANTQFTVEEDLGMDVKPRTSIRKGVSGKTKKPYEMEIAKLTISDGIFQKELEMSEQEWYSLLLCLPKGLINWKGVMIKVVRNGFDYKLEYMGTARQDMDGNAYNTPAPAPAHEAPKDQAPTNPARDLNTSAEMLSAALKQNTELGIITTRAILDKTAEKLYPNRALDVIMVAKTRGLIADMGDKEGWKGY